MQIEISKVTGRAYVTVEKKLSNDDFFKMLKDNKFYKISNLTEYENTNNDSYIYIFNFVNENDYINNKY